VSSLNLNDAYVLPGLLERFATLSGIIAHLDHYPQTIQQPPVMSHISQPSPAPRQVGQIVALHFLTLHRLHLKWQAWDTAEQSLRTYQDAIATLLEADPTLGGRIVHAGGGGVMAGGYARISGMAPGFVAVGDTTYRILDVTSDVLVKVGVSKIRTLT
jgi:hypothetical protein